MSEHRIQADRLTRRAHLRLLAGAAFFLPAVAHAQTAPPAPVSAEPSTTDPQAGDTPRTTRTQNGEIIIIARHYVPQGSATATKSDIPLIQTPQSISVITRDQIDLLNFIDAQQAVRYTAGAFGENYGPDPRYDFITVRGFTPKQYIDGLAVPATTTISAVGVDLYAFQSLDILKGPASVLYGAAPPGGILNEVSRRASPVFGGEVELKGGTHRFWEGAGTITGPLSPSIDVRMTGLYRNSHGEIDFQRNRRLLLEPTATLKLGSNTRLTGLFYYQHDHNLGGNGGFLPLYGTLLPNPTGLHIKRSTNLDDPKTTFNRNQWAGGYDFEHRFGGLTFHSNTKWSHYNEKTPIGIYSGGGFVNTTDPTLPSYYRTLQQYNFTYAEKVNSFATDNRFDARLTTGPIQHKLLIGLDYRNVRNSAAFAFLFAGQIDAFDPVYDPTFETRPGFPNAYNDQKLKQTGLYAQDQMQLGQLFLTLGGRQDWVRVNTFGDTQKERKFTYRAGANYVTSSGIAPYISYSTSFEPVIGKSTTTGEPFKPTSVSQWEGGVKYDARGLPSNVKLFATAALFDIKEKNFVVAQVGPTNPFGAVQAGKVEVNGFELELVSRFNERLSVNASYSYNHSEVKSNPNAPGDVGFPLPTTPKHKLSLFADYTLASGPLAGFGGGAGVRYNSASAGSLPSGTFPGVGFAPTIVTGRATLFDAILHYDQPRFRIAVNASNLFDKNYVARCTGLYGCVYGAGRQVIATLTGKF